MDKDPTEPPVNAKEDSDTISNLHEQFKKIKEELVELKSRKEPWYKGTLFGSILGVLVSTVGGYMISCNQVDAQIKKDERKYELDKKAMEFEVTKHKEKRDDDLHQKNLERSGEVRQWYLKKLLESKDDIQATSLLLSFLNSIVNDNILKTWAQQEIPRLERRQSELQEVQQQLKNAEERAKNESERAEQLEIDAKTAKQDRSKALALARQAKKDAKKAQEQLKTVQNRTKHGIIPTNSNNLQCKPNTTQIEFAENADPKPCGSPSKAAYLGISGWIYWSVSMSVEGKKRLWTCKCLPINR